ncbi:MAG: transcription elongation factor GreA [Chloroflexota bacterium]|nr:transcription elongation factor GreA [Chloroflexota bacterium]
MDICTLEAESPALSAIVACHKVVRDYVGSSEQATLVVLRRSVPITADGLQRLRDELLTLKERRREAAELIQQSREDSPGARDEGEGSETKNEQAFIEGRIREIEAVIAAAEIIDEQEIQGSDVVRLGSTVTVRPVPKRTDVNYRIVGPAEVDPKNGFLSDESPVGKALLGAKVGDTVEVATPTGVRKFKVKAIS